MATVTPGPASAGTVNAVLPVTVIQGPASVVTVVLPMAIVVQDLASAEIVIVVLLATVIQGLASVGIVTVVLLAIVIGILHQSLMVMTNSRLPVPVDRKRILILSSGSRITKTTNRFTTCDC
jgi:hypothetical protein